MSGWGDAHGEGMSWQRQWLPLIVGLTPLAVLLLLASRQCAHAQVLPDPSLTPGATLPGVTTSDICQPGWARRHRDVTVEEKRQVYAEYGDAFHDCHDQGSPQECEVDHLIPLELGGSNDITNLWPQPARPTPGYHEKDELESDLHALVCSGVMNLQDAQRCIASNWWTCYEAHER